MLGLPRFRGRREKLLGVGVERGEVKTWRPPLPGRREGKHRPTTLPSGGSSGPALPARRDPPRLTRGKQLGNLEPILGGPDGAGGASRAGELWGCCPFEWPPASPFPFGAGEGAESLQLQGARGRAEGGCPTAAAAPGRGTAPGGEPLSRPPPAC